MSADDRLIVSTSSLVVVVVGDGRGAWCVGFLRLDDGRLESLGRLAGHVRDERVELLLGVLLVVSLAGDAESHPVWDGLDAHLPNLLVELRVEPDVLGAHVLAGKLLDGLDGPRRPLLELHAKHLLVEVDGVVARHDVVDGLLQHVSVPLALLLSPYQSLQHTDRVFFSFFPGAIVCECVCVYASF